MFTHWNEYKINFCIDDIFDIKLSVTLFFLITSVLPFPADAHVGMFNWEECFDALYYWFHNSITYFELAKTWVRTWRSRQLVNDIFFLTTQFIELTQCAPQYLGQNFFVVGLFFSFHDCLQNIRKVCVVFMSVEFSTQACVSVQQGRLWAGALGVLIIRWRPTKRQHQKLVMWHRNLVSYWVIIKTQKLRSYSTEYHQAAAYTIYCIVNRVSSQSL